MKLPVLVYFAPEHWGEIEKFAHFYSSTYRFPKHIAHCVNGTAAHFDRARTLTQIAQSMIPSMQEDIDELEKEGYSRGNRAAQVSALVESAVMSLYSSVDAARKIVTHIYSKCQGMPDSTRKTFQGAVKGTIDAKVPKPIREAFKNAEWYPSLRGLRDTLTHVERGACHLDPKSGRVTYYHNAIGDMSKAFSIPDVFTELDSWFLKVNRFLGALFLALNQTLNDNEVWQMCGLFGGRIYSRYVRFGQGMDFNSGRCESFSWFDAPGNPRCPFADRCGAYENKS